MHCFCASTGGPGTVVKKNKRTNDPFGSSWGQKKIIVTSMCIIYIHIMYIYIYYVYIYIYIMYIYILFVYIYICINIILMMLDLMVIQATPMGI